MTQCIKSAASTTVQLNVNTNAKTDEKTINLVNNNDGKKTDVASAKTSGETPRTPTNRGRSDLAFSLASEVHIKGHDGAVFLPLCAKPSFLALIDKHESLLEDYMRHCLTTTDADVLIFIADGDVMGEALMATGGTSRTRAKRVTAAISARIRAKVDVAISKLNDVRIKGVVHWEDVASGSRFCKLLAKLEQVMACDVNNSLAAATVDKSTTNVKAGIKQIQRHVKTLVKNLFTQRVAKAHAAGCRMTNVFTGDGLALVSGARYLKRYRHLERACLLELCCIMVGFEHGDQIFTEMQYLTNDPRGMTYIAACLQQLRHTVARLPTSPNTECLKDATETHGITFIKFAPGPAAKSS